MPKPFSNDTDQKTEALLQEKFADMDLSERAVRYLAFLAGTRRLTAAGILHRYPKCSSEELKKRFAAILLGKNFTLEHFAWDPDKEGY